MIGLPKFLTHRAHEYMLYAWISCVRYCLPGATLEQAVKTFRKRFKIDENDLKISTAIKIWQKIDKHFDKMNSEGAQEMQGDKRIKVTAA